MIGVGAASDLGLGIGDTLTVDDRPFSIVGIYRRTIVWLDRGRSFHWRHCRRSAGEPAWSASCSCTSIGSTGGASGSQHRTEPAGAVTVQSEAEFGELDQGLEMMDAANAAISFLAVGIGAIGVMNTMGMAVFERTREIGILRAVGWSGARILRMILTEFLVLCGWRWLSGRPSVWRSEGAVRLTSVGVCSSRCTTP